MKLAESCRSVAIFLFLFIPFGSIDAVSAEPWTPPTKQDVCWKTSDGSVVVTFRFTNVGGNHYQLCGRATGKDGGIEPVIGSAEINGNTIYMTTISTGSNTDETWTFTGRWILNRTTKALSGEMMGVSHSKTDPDPQNAGLDYDGPVKLKFIACK